MTQLIHDAPPSTARLARLPWLRGMVCESREHSLYSHGVIRALGYLAPQATALKRDTNHKRQIDGPDSLRHRKKYFSICQMSC
jgi:hypothetical protein